MALDRVFRRILPALFVGGMPVSVSAQSAVPVHQEPRHHLVLEDSLFRILDVRIPPGDTTEFHVHDAPMAFVSISPALVDAQALGGTWATAQDDTIQRAPIGAVSWDETYARAPLAHRVTNIDDRLFRLIGIVHRGSGDPSVGDGKLGSAGPVEAEGRWFRSTHRTVKGNAALAWEAESRPVIAVLASDGKLMITSGAGKVAEKDGIGSFVVLTAGEAFTLRNPTPDDVKLAFVELR